MSGMFGRIEREELPGERNFESPACDRLRHGFPRRTLGGATKGPSRATTAENEA